MREAIAEHPGWYHSIELSDGSVTPGFCDLRPFAPQALPERLDGLRCLDVGTFDGFWAFELERRGAAEVLALDLADGREADWPPNTRAANEAVTEASGLRWGSGFALVHDDLDSAVQRVEGNVYALEPAWVGGPVDLVLCGTLLQHLRDPTGALERMRGVLRPGGTLLMIESYSVALTRRHRSTPAAEYRPPAPGSRFTWWMPNLACLRGWASTAGFVEAGGPAPRHRPSRGAGAGDHLVALTFRA